MFAGDNRDRTNDSRAHGYVPLVLLRDKAVIVTGRPAGPGSARGFSRRPRQRRGTKSLHAESTPT
jgi:hypothetical protein